MMQSSNGADLNQQQQQQQQQLPQQQQQQWMQHYQQQWMAMQYSAAPMVMPHQMMYQQHYMPYHQQSYQQQQQQQQPSQSQIQGSSDENKTIWVGDLQQWMDEGYLSSCFGHTGEVALVKVIRNKQTGQSERYGFIEFLSHAAAEKILQSYNGTVMPNTEQPFRLNWATFSTGDRRPDAGSDLSIFVGDLASDVTDTILFGDENEKSRAMTEMNGMYCSSRPMRIGVATPKKSPGHQQYSSQALVLTGGNASNGAMPQNSPSDGDSSNTTIFVGGLDSDVTDEDLRQSFSQFGEVLSVKIPAGKGCGFVQFADRSSAEDAMQRLNGTVIGKQTVRLSWGRTPGNKQLRTGSNNQWDGAYYGRQGYNGYGYAVPQNQDPSMYAATAAYGVSSNGYGNHQQPGIPTLFGSISLIHSVRQRTLLVVYSSCALSDKYTTIRMEMMIASPPVDFNFDSPSSPRRFDNFFFSAPTSPTPAASFYREFNDGTSGSLSKIPFNLEEKAGIPKTKNTGNINENDIDFEFDFSGELARTSLSADELFDGGKIKPLKPSPPPLPRLQFSENRLNDFPKSSPSSISTKKFKETLTPRHNKKVFDPFAEAIQETHKQSENQEHSYEQQRGRKNTRHKATRSLSSFRVCDLLFDREYNQQTVNSSTTVGSASASTSTSSWYRKWRLKDFFLFRSASEGRVTGKDPLLKKYASLKRTSDDVKNSSFRSIDSFGSSRRGPVSAHELHYTVNRAMSEEMKKKTFLPYKRGLLGCLGFNPAISEISRGLFP
ncbi:hypothetical protein F0562_020659 [Nyssa sinensis]|uniref:RRM domain-containing protein n=1 Tax=Nyssa sinensis TaxID=561372 RepID=A0A5J5BUY7_9ASTE|nr:hypothetical protein F0562_020659 [Nyssa sinensis]